MELNGHLSADVLGSSMDEFHNSWEGSIDMKLSYFYSRITSILPVMACLTVMCRHLGQVDIAVFASNH